MQGTEGQDGLPTAMAPTHPGAFHSLGRQRFAGGLHHTGANGEVLRLRFGIVHPVAVAAEIGQLGGQLLFARVDVSEMGQCPDDLLDARRLIPQNIAVLLERSF